MSPLFRPHRFGPHWVALVTLGFLGLSVLLGDQNPPAKPPSPGVFQLPELQGYHRRLETDFSLAMKKRDFAAAGDCIAKLIDLAPHDPLHFYNRACLRSLEGRREEVWPDLDRAVELGFRDSRVWRADRELALLHEDPRFSAVLAKADKLASQPVLPWVSPGLVRDGVAKVEEGNTAWDFRFGIFRSFFTFPDSGGGAQPVVTGQGAAGDLLRQWLAEGSAAGHRGDLYDNHDLRHSTMDLASFPQLSRIEYGEAAAAQGLANGLQLRLFYNAVVVGNSSTAVTGGLHWRSLPRLAYTTPGGPALLYAQYAGNHLYLYPEHRDHDVDHFGDVYPANTPYLITSQGSSGSDRPFLDAIACTLAAFTPASKAALAQRGALMPTIQMILRRTQKNAPNYLSGDAHPSAFDASQLDVLAMVRLAHAIEPDKLPPLVRLRMLEETQTVAGRDSFSNDSEGLFDTPAAIARVHRTRAFSRRMVVSAQQSVDCNGSPLTFRWALLRGDPALISMQPLNPEASIVELRIGHHTRRPIKPDSPLLSDRVDIGVFVSNGVHESAPAFVTTYFPANEKRVYDAEHRLRSADGTGTETLKAYVDPRIDGRRNWRDEFSYDAHGVSTGWVRTMGVVRQEFTADGRLITKRDGAGKILEVRKVSYPLRPGDKDGQEFAEIVPEVSAEASTYVD